MTSIRFVAELVGWQSFFPAEAPEKRSAAAWMYRKYPLCMGNIWNSHCSYIVISINVQLMLIFSPISHNTSDNI